MEIIEAYEEPEEPKNLVYLAKPVYGGWVTFTAHLSQKYGYPIHKLTKKTETTRRPFGYECEYHNMAVQDICGLPNVLITAIDKSAWGYLRFFPAGTGLVIHDPTECKKAKDGNPLVQETEYGSQLLNHFKIYTIRESVQEYLRDTFKVESTFLKHPFHAYPIPESQGLGYPHVSIARLDFDKNTHVMLGANQIMGEDTSETTDFEKPKEHIRFFGSENRIYVYHKLRELGVQDYWMGKFPKTFSPMYEDKSILKDARYMIDLSVIKQDGGGTQYTFLEAIYHDCVLVLHNEWICQGSTFQSGINCVGVSDERELATFLKRGLPKKDWIRIQKKSKELLKDHCGVRW